MKKVLLLSTIAVMVVLIGRAQVTLTPQVPPFGVLVKPQLWNMVLVNTSGRSITVYLSLAMTDVRTNQPVLTGSVMPFVLDRGVKQIQAKDLGPITYNYEGPIVMNRDPDGLLPAGEYRVCYSLGAGGKDRVAVENCIALAVDPLSPPLLNTPADEDSIFTTSPQFTWLPPTPAGLFSDLSYDLILVEVLPGQAKGDAIQQNVPIYSGGLIRDQYLNYASSYASLDTGRVYAWRIVAMNGGQPAAMSDIWTFRVVKPSLPTVKMTNDPYLSLKRGLDATVAAGSVEMRFFYDNMPADTTVAYTITSIDDPGNPVVQRGELRLVRGENLLQVALSKTAGYDAKKVYLFRLVNSRNERWMLKFTGAAK